ncbi:MAG TPA: HAMP domain-containing sensor histidine kinase [Terriglobia bacterium]|jgi:two-component system sensor histidine kinase CpxA
MKPAMSLASKITLLTLLTLVLLTAFFLIFAAAQFRISPTNFIVAPTLNHLTSVAGDVAQDLAETPAGSRIELLSRLSEEYGVEFYLVDVDGNSLTGVPADLPQAIRTEISQRIQRVRDDAARRAGVSGRAGPAGVVIGPWRVDAIFRKKTGSPSEYWVGVPIRVRSAENPEPSTGFLVLRSDSIIGNEFFFDPKPWVALTLALTLVFVIIWLPWIRRLTGAISAMKNATSRIAEGQFEIQLKVERSDEVGHLASSINRMSTQLAHFVKGQKRFLADVAHELCAPTARMQVALGILEQRAGSDTREYVEDITGDVRHMSELINELLSFSKTGMLTPNVELTRVDVGHTVRRVVELEKTPDTVIETSVPKDLAVLADSDYLFRALSNLVRNAIRYAGQCGPISVSAHSENSEAVITVADHGPGVPDTALDDVFTPFFRLDASRSRDSGGTGLGLAIVKTCVEACKGSVLARNRRPAGLEVEIRLKMAAT